MAHEPDPKEQDKAAITQPGSGTGEKDFVSTVTEDIEHPATEQALDIDIDVDLAPGVWHEATDGRCSQNAALFAASQPAPMNVV